MILGIELDKKIAKVSEYKPSQEIKDRTMEVINDFRHADTLRNQTYEEFNDLDLIDRMNASQKEFNGYVPAKSDDPDEAWRSNAKRPITRNRAISIAAHVTGSIIKPKIFAQNDRDDEDQDAGVVMRDLMDWAEQQAEYDRIFVYAVISALYNPATIIHEEYREIYRTIKEIQDDGSWEEKEIKDEEQCGFKMTLVPVDELYIANFYEHDIQKQPFLIWRRFIDYTTAQSKYGDSDNFKYVVPGIQTLYNEKEDTFYEQADDDLEDRLVEEFIYYNKSQDLQLAFVNGVLMDDKDQPNPRKDKKYPFAKGGYELIDEGKFFYYKSLADKMYQDQQVIDTLYQLVIDGSFLQLMPPQALFGKDEINASLMIPGVMTQLDINSKIQSLAPNANLNAGFASLQAVEGSLSESSQDILQSGQSIEGNQTAFEISRLEQNSRVMLGLFGKMIGFMVKDLGNLLMSDVCQYLTISDVEEITDGNSLMKFRNFLLADRSTDKGIKTRKLEFTTDMPTSEEDLKNRKYALMDAEGGVDNDKEIYKINPVAFRNLKFKVQIEPDFKTPTSELVQKALNLELYDRLIANPMADQEAALRDVLLSAYEKTKADPERYINKQVPATTTGGGQPKPTDLIKQMAGGGMSTADLAK